MAPDRACFHAAGAHKPAEIASLLQIKPGTDALIRHQRRYLDDQAGSLQTSFYPMTLVTSGNAFRLTMADDIREGVVQYLADANDIKQAGYRDRIAVRAPDATEQSFFSIPDTVPVLELLRTAFDQAGTPLRVTVTIFPADRYQLIVDIGHVPALQREPATAR
jgi:GntR family transcriptional regulator